MSTTTPTTLRALYRALLRELPTSASHPTHIATTRTAHAKLSAPSSVQRSVRAAFAASTSSNNNNNNNNTTSTSSASTTPTSSSAAQLGLAQQAILYAQAQREYCALIERYNPGMGMSEEERVRLSARRIGMNLPVEFEAEAEGKGQGEK
jgi:ATP synthase assembly factor FMC1